MLALLLVLLLFALPVQAQTIISLPYTENFDCPDIACMTAKGWVYVDGAFFGGSPTTTTRMTSTNTFAGSGALLQEFIDNSDGQHSSLKLYHTPVAELYARVYGRYDRINQSLPFGHVNDIYPSEKWVYFNDAGTDNEISNVGGYWWFGSAAGSPSYTTQHPTFTETCVTSGSQNATGCVYPPNINAVPMPYGQYACVIWHMKANTPGQADGRIRIWLNGTLTTDYQNVRMRSTSAGLFRKINIFRQFAINVQRRTDQLTLSTTPLTCDGSIPTPDTTPPSAPSSLTSTGQTYSTITMSWTNGVDGVDTNLNAVVQGCTGSGCTNFVPLFTLGVQGGSISTFTDSNLSASTIRCYRVNNLDASNNASTFTSPMCTSTTAAPAEQLRRTRAIITFNVTDEDPLSDGSSWDGGYTSHTDAQVVSNAVQGTELGTPALMTYNGVTDFTDTWCQITIQALAGSVQTTQGCLLQYADSPDDSGYQFLATINGTPKTSIVEKTAGVPTVHCSDASTVWMPGDLLRGHHQGSNLEIYRNDTLICSGTDSTRSNGKVGIYLSTASGGGAGSITYDSSNSKTTIAPSTSTFTVNHTVSAGSNPVLYFCVANRHSSTAPTFTSVTFNGDAMTQDVTKTVTFGATNDTRVSMYKLVNPDVGTYPITVTTSGVPATWIAGASISLFGVDQTTPSEATASRNSTEAGGPSAAISQSVTTLTDNAWVIDCPVAQAWGPMTVGSGQTQRFNNTSGDDSMGLSHRTKATAGSQAMSWTQTDSLAWATVLSAVKPAGGGDAGDLAQNVLDSLVIGDWVTEVQPTVTNAVCTQTGCQLTYGGDAPTYVRVLTGSNSGTPPATDIVYPVASIPSGLYTTPTGGWITGQNFVCFFAQNATHVESTNPLDYQCRDITALVQSDVTAPVLTAGFPDGETITTTTATLAIVSNEDALVKIGTVDEPFDDLDFAMTTFDKRNHTYEVTGLSNGEHIFYACGQDFAEPNPNQCTVRTTITVTVNTGGADTTPPTAPSAFSCTAFSPSQATCTFENGTDAVGIVGNRATIGTGSPCTPTTIINPTWSTATTQTLTGLTPGSAYCAIVQHFDAAGNVSAASNTASFSTLSSTDPIPPTVVPHCWVTTSTIYALTVQCDPSFDFGGIASYTFEACEGATCEDFEAIGTQSIPLIIYSDLSQDTVYRFRVIARDVSGNVSRRFSKIITATTSAIGWNMTPGLSPGKRKP